MSFEIFSAEVSSPDLDSTPENNSPSSDVTARFLPGLGGGGGGGGMAMPMSGMPGDPLIAFSSMEDKLLGNKPH